MSECIHCGASDDREHGVVVGLVGELNETVCNVCRTEDLRERTVLSQREAEVYALKEQGYSHADIADILQSLNNEEKPKKSTVDEYSRRINDRVERAQATVEILG